ncbi:MAG: hypothetical protein ACRDVW_10505 [Acidimicrobiales bacterium]
MSDSTQAAVAEAEKPSALQVIAGDAERILAGFVPDVNKLPKIVGALIKQVEQLAGGKLEPLADEVLGIAAGLEQAPEAPAAGISSAEADTLRAQMSEQGEVIKALQAKLAADSAAAPEIDGSGQAPTSGSGEAAA